MVCVNYVYNILLHMGCQQHKYLLSFCPDAVSPHLLPCYICQEVRPWRSLCETLSSSSKRWGTGISLNLSDLSSHEEYSFARCITCVFSDMPKQYIYEPWTAPLAVQKKANCIIGVDYPRPSTSYCFLISFELVAIYQEWMCSRESF
jgi:hypothetical protein